ncbi:MAG: UDP-N-acetylmuramoyl-L-alanine--D-glutamate ligase [Alphaproteobacteria bacterium]|nr:UDP-N-acetylmuramoyl-L-alanine--D-glutamate ligase [Alphaproteobacteria bacterium]
MIHIPGISGSAYAVMGLGVSGLAAAEALAASGARVVAWDDDETRRETARSHGVAIADLAHDGLDDASALVLSPGIPHTFPEPHPIAARAKSAGIPIICDVELLTRAKIDCRFIGITGTNGKSTVTALLGHIFEIAGRPMGLGGNLGPAALTLDELSPEGTYVLELSSYQIERLETAAFDIAVLINISPDHLERHGGIEGYVAAKEGLFALAREGAIAVIGIDDGHCRAVEKQLRAHQGLRVIPISGSGPVQGGVWVEDGHVIDGTGENVRLIADLITAPALSGRHNQQNAAAATAAALAAGIRAEDIASGLAGYPGLPHRMEVIRHLGAVTYINDSKATNADAALNALNCYGQIFWIAGGRSKEGGFGQLAEGDDDALDHVRHAFLIGEAAQDIGAALGTRVPHTICGTLGDAVVTAHAAAHAAAHAGIHGAAPDSGSDGSEGVVVLLSPACASFDQFTDFAARGEVFRHAVAALDEVAS